MVSAFMIHLSVNYLIISRLKTFGQPSYSLDSSFPAWVVGFLKLIVACFTLRNWLVPLKKKEKEKESEN